MPRTRVKPIYFEIFTGNEYIDIRTVYSRTKYNHCTITIIEDGEIVTCYRISSTEFKQAYEQYQNTIK